MKVLYGVSVLFITITIMDVVRSDLIDMAMPTIFDSKDKTHMSCYDCINVTHSDCNDIPPNSTSFVTECNEGANGCIKKLYHDDGYTIMSRECYYGPVQFIRDLSCEGTKITYAQEKCYLCTTDLCNSSQTIYASSYNRYVRILFTIFMIMQVSKVF